MNRFPSFFFPKSVAPPSFDVVECPIRIIALYGGALFFSMQICAGQELLRGIIKAAVCPLTLITLRGPANQ